MNNPFGNSNADPNEKPKQPEQQLGPATGHDKFGEVRPTQPRIIDAVPYKIEKACKCHDHVVMSYSLEMDVPDTKGMSQLDMVRMMMSGEQPPVKRQWVPVSYVLSSYN